MQTFSEIPGSFWLLSCDSLPSFLSQVCTLHPPLISPGKRKMLGKFSGPFLWLLLGPSWFWAQVQFTLLLAPLLILFISHTFSLCCQLLYWFLNHFFNQICELRKEWQEWQTERILYLEWRPLILLSFHIFSKVVRPILWIWTEKSHEKEPVWLSDPPTTLMGITMHKLELSSNIRVNLSNLWSLPGNIFVIVPFTISN